MSQSVEGRLVTLETTVKQLDHKCALLEFVYFCDRDS